MNEENTDLPSKLQPPKPSGLDKVYSIIKAVVAGVPLVGGSASELMELVFAPPYFKRMQKWNEDVAKVLAYLVSTKGIRIEELRDNERFISAVANTYQIAMRNHEAEKRAALRNALINTVIDETIDESLHNQFMNYIDTLTVLHIQLLRIFAVSERKGQQGGYFSSLAQVIEESIPELRDKRHIYDSFWRDLFAKGLVNIDQLHVTMTPSGAHSKRITYIGDQFIKFISNPKDNE